ncbi:MAG: DNA-processing protein DprA [Cyanobacteria bacterium J06648_11]
MTWREYTPEELLDTLSKVERQYAPKKLFLAGSPELAQTGTRVAIVGSRKASRDALVRATKLAHSLVEAGVTVVSGLAFGVDTAAHEAAIRAGGHRHPVGRRPSMGGRTPRRRGGPQNGRLPLVKYWVPRRSPFLRSCPASRSPLRGPRTSFGVASRAAARSGIAGRCPRRRPC